VIAISDQAAAAVSGSPILQGRTQRNGRATAYVCERYACQNPVTDPDALNALLS
jgi:uncharacterized protein YyaL (SSP411 family)